jgi:hypothetical protein
MSLKRKGFPAILVYIDNKRNFDFSVETQAAISKIKKTRDPDGP